MLRFGILSLIRSYSSRSPRIYRDKKLYTGDQAGVRRQTKVLGDADLWEEDQEGDYEADFSKAHLTMREHESEMARQKERVKLKIIERKYFRTKKQPSFLTWAEKEQIRHLNQQDPDEWNAQRLSESFPATEDTILKIIKAKWTPIDMKRVRDHDENIKKNWQAYKANKLVDLDPDLKEHLAKFSQRKFDSSKNAYALSKNNQVEFKFPKPKHQEFLHIVSSCKALWKAKEIAQNKCEKIEAAEQETAVMVNESNMMPEKIELPKQLRTRNITFTELQKKLGLDEEKADEGDFHVKFSKEPHAMNSPKTQTDVNNTIGLEDFVEIDLNHSEYSMESSEMKLVANESDAQIARISSAPKIQKYLGKKGNVKSMINSDDSVSFIEKIVIPSNVRKKGALYKVNDCFYDDNGDILFRVPGLKTDWH